MKKSSPYKIIYTIGITGLILVVISLSMIFLQIYNRYGSKPPFSEEIHVTYDTIHKPIIVWDTIEKPFFYKKTLSPSQTEKIVQSTENVDSIK